MTDRTVLEKRLAEAEEALHQLSIGQSEAMIVDGSKTISYRSADLPRLQTYIASLRQQLGLPGASRRPLRPVFG